MKIKQIYVRVIEDGIRYDVMIKYTSGAIELLSLTEDEKKDFDYLLDKYLFES